MEIIEYEFRSKNKFSHLVYADIFNLDPDWTVLTKWLNENCGPYRVAWICPTKSRNILFWPYAFKDLEHAMAFKLYWMS